MLILNIGYQFIKKTSVGIINNYIYKVIDFCILKWQASIDNLF